MTEKELLKVIAEAAKKGSTKLYLRGKKIARLPPEIGQLENLTTLDLHLNQLTALPPALGQLQDLTHLSLQSNRLTALPPEIGQLKNLTHLYLLNNQLTALPPALGQLRNLTHLYLLINQLTALPPEIGQLRDLNVLYLRDNRLTTLPPELGQLKDLTHLDLNNNQLTALPPELGQLENLTFLWLENNQLKALPPELGQLKSLKGLYLHGNEKLGIPHDVLGPSGYDVAFRRATSARPSDILAYYFQIKAQSRPLNEVKLILVGRGEVGKTCVVNRLVRDEFSYTNKTEGIQITSWDVSGEKDKVRLNIWDFGGQEIMHATHQFFLTERSLYLLVLNGREGGEDTDAEYWLKLIASFGGDSPVIIVLNKVAQHPFDVNRRALQAKYPQIRDFVKTDCAQPIGIDDLHSAIGQAISKMSGVRDLFPAAWFSIKDKLGRMKETLAANYISYDRYRELCRELGEKDPKRQDQLAHFLHCLGIALNYKDDPRLRDMSVLNPHWVTNGIYRLLNARGLAERQGVLQLSDLAELLPADDYPAEKHAFLLELMHRFRLCFAYPDSDHYLVPELLDKQEPELGEEFAPLSACGLPAQAGHAQAGLSACGHAQAGEKCLNFEYHYTVLPEGLLPGFIVRAHGLNRDLPRWRSGVVLAWEGCRALVKADVADHRVVIRVHGEKPESCRRLLAVIRADFERIHQEIPKLDVTERVPVRNHPEVVIDYQELLAFERKGRQEFDRYIGGEVVTLSVPEMLNGIDRKPPRTMPACRDDEGGAGRPREPGQEAEALKVFTSYSHKDDQYREELRPHLTLLERDDVIRVWSDRRILPGDDWAGKIDENLESADIILLLVSADFIASRYCYEIEMKRALEREKAGETRVIPVIIRDCEWHTAPFGKLQPLPKEGKAVQLWRVRDTAWRNVAEGIRRVAQEMTKRRGGH